MKNIKGMVLAILIGGVVLFGIYVVIKNNIDNKYQAAVGGGTAIDAPVSATVGLPFTYQVPTKSNTKSFDATGLPDALVIDKATGIISGIPNVAGTFLVSITRTSNSGATNTTNYNFIVNPSAIVALPAPVITSVTSASGTVGAAFSYQITADNSPTSFSATNLPAGLSIDTTTGLISGTPTTSGATTVSLGATNATGTGSQNLTLSIATPVIAPVGSPVISNSAMVKGQVGVSYGPYQIYASNKPTSYDAVGLPSGLSVNKTTGVITGIPTINGTFSVILKATNAIGTGTKTFSLLVNPAAPIITSSLTESAVINNSYSYQITATNNPTSFAISSVPTGLTFDTKTGVLSGVPTGSARTVTPTIKAINAGGTGSSTLNLTFTNEGIPVVSPATVSAKVGSSFSHQIVATNNPKIYKATNIPPGITLNTATGLLSGTPDIAKDATFNLTVTATNASGTSDAATISIVISGGSNQTAYQVWGIGAVVNYYLPARSRITGTEITYLWDDVLQPQKDVFDWSNIDAQIKTAYDNGLDIGLMVYASPTVPSWMYCAEDASGNAIDTGSCVPKVHTDAPDQQFNVFPYYMNSFYQAQYRALLNAFNDHIATLPQEWRNKIVFWEIGVGSTGDEDPYKGNPINPVTRARETKYDISDSAWKTYKYSIWLMARDIVAAKNSYLKLLLNTGGGSQYFEWVLANIPCAWMKNGDLTHEYSFVGEIHTWERSQIADNQSSSCGRSRGEFQNAYDFPTWDKAPDANTFTLTLSALTMGLDIFNLTAGSFSKAPGNSDDLTLYKMFTKYAGIRTATETNKAWVYLRDAIDVADTVRFPEDTYYGPVISTTSQQAYNNAVATINKNPDLTATERAEKITALKEKYFNTSRLTKIVSDPQWTNNSAVLNKPSYVEVPGESIFEAIDPFPNTDPSYAVYDSDFGLDLYPGNYGMFIKQLNPNSTSIGQWRIGSLTSRYGRYARSFDAAGGKKVMTFDIDDTIKNSTRIATTKVSVTYYDSGTSQWSLNYATGLGTLGSTTIVNQNSNTWKTYTTTINNMALSNKVNSGDLSLNYVSGGNTIFAMIEVELQ